MSDSERLLVAFRLMAVVEATTYLGLLGAVVLGRIVHGPDLVRPMGWIHGVAFLVYAAVAVALGRQRRWSSRRTTEILIAAVVPLGGYVVAHRLAHEVPTGRGPSPEPAP